MILQAWIGFNVCPQRVVAQKSGKGRPRRVWRWVAISAAGLCLALPVVGMALQLPPEIEVDRYLLQAEEQIEKQDFRAAKEAMDRILELREQHDLELPEEFFFRYAHVLERVEQYDEAIKFATRYLTLAGRDGAHYRDALQVLNSAEAAKRRAEERQQQAQARVEAARRRAEAVRDRAQAERRGADEVITGMEFVRVPAGEFRMGYRKADRISWERPTMRVRITRAFDLGKYEVTRSEWQKVMGTSPWSDSSKPECRNCPAEWVSWEGAQEFIGRLNARAGGVRYRLPTEAEWEYAARAGTRGDFYSDDLDAIAWYDENSDRRSHPVGQKAPNVWGLHDMLGNAQEWVQDWADPYPGGTVTDPQGPRLGSLRVFRGGSYFSEASGLRVSIRNYTNPDGGGWSMGFRLLRIAP